MSLSRTNTCKCFPIVLPPLLRAVGMMLSDRSRSTTDLQIVRGLLTTIADDLIFDRLTLNERTKSEAGVLKDVGVSSCRVAVRRRNKSNPWFRRGEGYRCALDVLRKAEAPLTVRQVADRMLATRGISDASQKQVRDLAGGILTSLRNHQGAVVRVGEGMPMRWIVAT